MLSSVRQAFLLLDAGSRPWLAAYLASAMLAAVLEAVGLGLIFAFFQIVMAPGDFGGSETLVALHGFLGAPAPDRFLSILTVVVILAFVMRTGLLLLTSWVALAMRRHVELGMVGSLFRGYLDKPLVWHLVRGSSRLMNNIAHNVGLVVQHIIIGSLDILGAMVMITLIFATMGWLRPFETMLAIVVLGVSGTAYFFLVQHRAMAWGKLMVGVSEARWRTVREPLRGIKTVKVLALENYFASQVDHNTRRFLDVFLKQGMVQVAPRLVLEVILVGGILVAMALALGSGRDAQSIVPMMALFGVAAMRMLPLVTRILQTLQYIRYSQSALATLQEDIGDLVERTHTSRHAEAVVRHFENLSLRNVSFAYPGASRMAIRGVDLDIRKGEQIALVGLSGAGKTTLADMLLGLVEPADGVLLLNGQRCTGVPPGLFAYVPQDPFIVHDTLRRNIALGVPDDQVDQGAVARAVEGAALDAVVGRLPKGLDTLMGEDGTGLSGGEKQRLGIARALYRDASVLVMDEPTSSLDALTEAEISATIAGLRQTRTVVLVAHRLSSIKTFDRVVFMEGGHVAASGTFGELYAGNDRFRTMVDYLSVATVEEGKSL
ncbi:MAG: ABC transporter ATP-binding protein [Candidatus Desulfobacillus denitrificans]|nr:MAG: ATP-binding cassette domain-containing protein [Rhodocyclaceae bacterium]MCG3146400.1 Protein glycosylation K [Gammaproteobacteria bacterium]CAG0927332.1 Protein glycosylation K [Rhodocyclaceae bacterium]